MPNENDQNLNPGQSDYERKTAFDPSKKQTNENSDQNSTASDLKNSEENPNKEWDNKYTGQNTSPSKTKKFFKLNNIKKKGPLTAIILSLGGGGLIIGTLLSPSMLLVNMKEVISKSLNTQLASQDIRTTRALVKKFEPTKGICNNKVSIKCRYASMSDRQIKNFEKAGIKIEFDADASKSLLALGRKKPTGFSFEGKTILANNLRTELASNPSLRSALKRAYNPLFAGFSDSVWKRAASVLKISKTPRTFSGNDYDSKMASLETEMKEENQVTKKPTVDGDDIDPETGSKYSDLDGVDLDDLNNQIEATNDLIDAAGGDGSVISNIKNGASEVFNAVKITQGADYFCTVYSTAKAIGYASKTIRVAQMASFAMLFLNAADQIKAGDAKPEDVEFLSTILTKNTLDDNGDPKSATDSMGYRYVMYGDTTSSSYTSSQYMAAAGFTGAFAGIMAVVSGPLTNTTCKFLANGFVSLASVAAGIAATILSGGTTTLSATAIKASIKLSAKEALRNPKFWASTAAEAGIITAAIVLPGILSDIISGNTINSSTVGSDAGDAIVSGSSGIMGTTAKFGGNAPLTPEQAVEYKNLTDTVAAEYAEEDRLDKSPLDISTPNTFIGNIISNLIPYTTKIKSAASLFTSISAFTRNSLVSIFPQTKAASLEEFTACEDPDYVKMGLATDPFCNVVYGIPSEYLSIDPFEVIDWLVADGSIYEYDEEGHVAGDIVPDKNLDKFIDACINRSAPLGYSGYGSDGSECLVNDKNIYYYLYTIDRRVQNGMDGVEEDVNTTGAYDGMTAQQLAKSILQNDNIKDNTGQIAEIAAGTSNKVDIEVLKFILNLGQNNTFTISSLWRDYVPENGSQTSKHLVGKAVDISGSNPINGKNLSYDVFDSDIQDFINQASGLLINTCQIGVPNSIYETATNSISNCNVFKDIGTGAHLHFAVEN